LIERKKNADTNKYRNSLLDKQKLASYKICRYKNNLKIQSDLIDMKYGINRELKKREKKNKSLYEYKK
jgi:hypothetical protein